MKFYYGGSEIKAWRNLLISQQIPTVALSYVGLRRRFKKNTDSWRVSENYPDFQQVFLDSGAYTLNRNDSEYTKEQAQEIAAEYMAFVDSNIDAVTLVSEFDAQILGKDAINAHRSDFYNALPPEKFMPVWHTEYGIDELENLASTYSVVGICQSDARDTSLIPVFNSCVNRYGVRLHGVALTGMDMMKAVNWDSVSSMSWLSPSIYGDTIIWTGRELKRYPRAYKNNARKKHRNIFMDNGFDFNKIEADDSNELLKLSLWSWNNFVQSLSSKVTTHGRNENSDLGETGSSVVAIAGSESRNENLPAIAENRETKLIPIVGIKHFAQEEGGEEQPFLVKRSESMRVCNSCFLRDKCPGFKPNANCLYNIPIEVKTKDQRTAVKKALIEMQTQRVLFMQMAEDLEGGYADPNLSSELDRLQRMIKADEESEKNRFSFSVEAEQSNAGPSFIEKIFGQDTSNKLKQLEAPVLADDLIKDSEIYDVEVISDK